MRLVAATPDSTPLPESYRAVFNTISQDYLRDTVKRVAVPRVYGTPENEAVCKTIVDLFSGTQGAQTCLTVDREGNVIAGDPLRARILIGAHYDAVPGTPGADDNASAVAVLLAAARAIGFHEDICYIAFNGEECGFVGSQALVKFLGSTRPEQVHILEMVGFTIVPASEKVLQSPQACAGIEPDPLVILFGGSYGSDPGTSGPPGDRAPPSQDP